MFHRIIVGASLLYRNLNPLLHVLYVFLFVGHILYSSCWRGNHDLIWFAIYINGLRHLFWTNSTTSLNFSHCDILWGWSWSCLKVEGRWLERNCIHRSRNLFVEIGGCHLLNNGLVVRIYFEGGIFSRALRVSLFGCHQLLFNLKMLNNTIKFNKKSIIQLLLPKKAFEFQNV